MKILVEILCAITGTLAGAIVANYSLDFIIRHTAKRCKKTNKKNSQVNIIYTGAKNNSNGTGNKQNAE